MQSSRRLLFSYRKLLVRCIIRNDGHLHGAVSPIWLGDRWNDDESLLLKSTGQRMGDTTTIHSAWFNSRYLHGASYSPRLGNGWHYDEPLLLKSIEQRMDHQEALEKKEIKAVRNRFSLIQSIRWVDRRRRPKTLPQVGLLRRSTQRLAVTSYLVSAGESGKARFKISTTEP